MTDPGAGALRGLRFVEFDGLGPVPFASTMLCELGASGVRIVRDPSRIGDAEPYWRGRPAIVLDLKASGGVDTALDLVAAADVLIEGYRPGVMERLGLDPATCLTRNPGLVYGRISGYGREGPWREVAGHDVNYLAVSGALDWFRRGGGPPVPPLNIVGDFAGGALYLLVGVLAALGHVARGGRGQVVDATITDGIGHLMMPVIGRIASGTWSPEPSTNTLDSGAPYYQVYETSDGRWLAVGAIEPAFYARFVDSLGLDAESLPDRTDRRSWPALRGIFAETIRSRSLAMWTARFDGVDACVTPVLTLDEASAHPDATGRDAYARSGPLRLRVPTPRFSATPGISVEACAATTPQQVLERWSRSTTPGRTAEGTS